MTVSRPARRFRQARSNSPYSGFVRCHGLETGLAVDGCNVEAACCNASGWVVGTVDRADGSGYGFLWRDGIWLPIDAVLPDQPDDRTSTSVFWINARGQLVGRLTDRGGNGPGFLFTPDSPDRPDQGTFVPLLVENAVNVIPQVVNAAGIVVGYAEFPVEGADNETRAFLWRDGAATPIEPLPGSSMTLAIAINNAGWIVGYYYDDAARRTRGFLWRSGEFVALDVDGALETLPSGINDAGQVVGTSIGPGGSRAFLYDGAFQSLDPGLGAVDSHAAAINDAGDIVGDFLRDGRRIGFVSGRAGMAWFDRPGATGTIPYMISSAGTIVGYATYPDPQ